ncbi:MAG: glycosyltransferase family 2 protein [Defluviitaleaceae bacterium]|nr:glycosyltransferase family 2 protein [Defluviitaleaceae bacterium]
MPVLSIVIPAYNEGDSVRDVVEAVQSVTIGIKSEIIFVDDGSGDNTWDEICALAKNYPGESSGENLIVRGISFSRNFGKEAAMLAGLSHARGDACAIMDCDLQHPPGVLVDMYAAWREGDVDIVQGAKHSRGKESLLYKFFAGVFYFLMKRAGGVELRDSSDFQLLDRRVVDTLMRLPERQRFFRALSTWTGFRRRRVSFKVEPRRRGKSKFNFYTSAKYALSSIISFSSAPMQMVTFVGVIFFFASVVLGGHTVHAWFSGRAVEGFTTVILLLLIIGSMLMVSLGIIGLYIGKIYDEIKQRPHYVIRETSDNR